MKWHCLVSVATVSAIALIGGRAAADPQPSTGSTPAASTPAANGSTSASGTTPSVGTQPSTASGASPGIVTPAPVAPTTGTTTTTGADLPTDSTENATTGSTTTEPARAETVTVKRNFRPNVPWLVTGGAILVGTYVPTAAIAGAEGRPVKDRNLLIPVVGPWLNIANRQCGTNGNACAHETEKLGLIFGSGVLQGAGVLLGIASFFIPEKIEAATIQAGPVKMNVLPTQVGMGGMGVGSVGTF